MLLKGNHFYLITNKNIGRLFGYRYFWWNQYRTSVHVKKPISVHLYIQVFASKNNEIDS